MYIGTMNMKTSSVMSLKKIATAAVETPESFEINFGPWPNNPQRIYTYVGLKTYLDITVCTNFYILNGKVVTSSCLLLM